MPAISAGEPSAQIRGRLHENADNFLEEESRRKDLKTPHQEQERHHQRLEHYREELETPHQESHPPFHPGTQLLRCSGSNLPLPFGSHWMQGIMGTASMRSNLLVEEAFDSTHAKGASGADPSATGLDFTILDSPEKELENLRASIKRTLQENDDKSPATANGIIISTGGVDTITTG